MGSWNGTCALTNLPIGGGAPVVAYVLNSQGACRVGGGGVTEVDAYASPYGLPLRGHYNSYGGVNRLRDDVSHRWWLKRLSALKLQLMTGEAEALPNGWLSGMETFLNEGVTRGEVYVGLEGKHGDEGYEPTSALGLMLMHEEAFNRFMACSLASDDWMFEGCPLKYYRKSFEQDAQRGAELWTVIAGARQLARSAPGPEHREAQTKSFEAQQELAKLLDAYRCFGWDSFEIIGSVYQEAQQAPEILESLAEHHVFNMMLGCARKQWALQCGRGSDNTDVSLQVEMAKFALEFTGNN